jgi:hypothetical protein
MDSLLIDGISAPPCGRHARAGANEQTAARRGLGPAAPSIPGSIRRFVVLYSELVRACGDNFDALDFIIAPSSAIFTGAI